MQESKKVPCWMFIRWISQMMALLDKEEGPCVVPILTEIARQYPQVLYLALLIVVSHVSLPLLGNNL
jgi:DNA-dependent protein kinase catalytic subunit